MRLRIAGHPIHPMLTDFPVGLWVISFVWDIVAISTGNPMWWSFAFWTMLIGLIMALPTAVTGMIDFTGIRAADPAKRTAVIHMVLNLIVASLFLVNLLIRGGSQPPESRGLAVLLSGVAVFLLAISGWLGAKLVYVHRVGTEEKVREEGTPTIPRREPVESERR
jgi:uncharacterized membrane protein